MLLRRIIIIAVNVLCLTAFIICLAVSSSLRAPLRSQQVAAAWAGQSGERFSQLSVFFPVPSSFDENQVHALRDSLDRVLLSESLESTDDSTLYTDAWSSVTEVSLISQRGTATAKAIATGGDFFLFHPLKLRDGGYLSPNDVMKDRVVLDEELAWRLFGAVNIAGFEVIINNSPFIIAGVVARENDFANSKAYTYGAGLFMSYEMLLEMTEGNAKIECYEIVLPNPIAGFALSLLPVDLKGDDMTDPSALIVENTTRFSLGNSFALLGSFGERSMRTDAYHLPYWENAARYAEDWIALLLLLSLIFIAFPVVCAIIYLVILIRFGVRHCKVFINQLIKKKDKRAYEKYILEHGEDGEAVYNVNDIIREVQDEIY
ncbi:MAG: ABC transporter permease [Oscillospiraceae bacterium]|nr:ABC transporter permease [Oscillospiraceae bacterium]